MKRNENVTSIAKRLEKTGDISQRDADYVYSCFSEGYVNDAFVEEMCIRDRNVRTSLIEY